MDRDAVKKSEVFEQFIIFMSLPDPEKAGYMGLKPDIKTNKYDRIPTQGDFAIKFGVSKDTLSLWKKRNDFITRVDLKRKEWGIDKVPNVLAALYTRCIKYGMAYDVETYLAYYANWNRTQVIKTVGEKFDVDDLRALIAELPPTKQADAYAALATIITEADRRRGGAEIT